MLIIIISRSSLKLDHVGSKTRLLGHQATQVSDLGPLWPSCLLIYPFFSDVVMASHGGAETKTISYMSKFLKYAPEMAGGGGRKEN